MPPSELIPRRFSRSGLLKRAGIAGTLAAAAGSATAKRASAAMPMGKTKAKAPTKPAGALTASQLATLQAVAARIVPTDATGPGATEAGAANYINLALAGWPTPRNSLGATIQGTNVVSSLPAYQAGLPAVDAYAQSKKGALFANLSPADQDAVLTDLSAGVNANGFVSVPGGSTTALPPQTPNETAPGSQQTSATPQTPITPVTTSAAFFTLVRTHVLQGVLSDPYYGGNQNFVGWKWVRYPGIRMPVKRADQELTPPLLNPMSAYDMPSYKSGPPTLKG
jgi:gluconate 2-dehydrogenase gamma chain